MLTNEWDMIIKNGQAVLSDRVVEADIAVEDGKIAAIGKDLGEGKNMIDAKGLLVFPGGIDAHVHFNDPRPIAWEGWEKGTKSAAAGGITTVVEMPLNGVPPVIDTDAWDLKRSRAKDSAWVDYALWGGLIHDNLKHLPELYERGAAAFKAFTAEAIDYPMADDAVLFEAMKWAAESGALIGIHCENNPMSRYYSNLLKAQGRTDWHAFLESFPEESELESIHKVLFLAKRAGCRLHICHTSLPEGIEMIKEAGLKQKVTVETCPHYLCLTEEDYMRIGPAALCTPPIRSPEAREKLWEQVVNGDVDIITSDHAPTCEENKLAGMENIWKSWCGISGIQSSFCAVWTEGQKHGLTPVRMAQLYSSKPAEIFGLAPEKGSISIGADADMILFDPNEEWTLKPEMLNSLSKISAYNERNFKGRIKKTILRGSVICDEGQIGERKGRWIRPNRP